MYTVEDVLVRWHRMKGDPTLWVPGADHASIAVHVVVERELAKEGITRQQLGRDAFLERTWETVNAYRGRITRPVAQPGLLARLVALRLYDGRRPLAGGAHGVQAAVSGGPHLPREPPRELGPVNQTTVSDLEAEQWEEDGHLWYLRYDVADEPGQSLTVATTRPETMLGDTAVAVNPDDERYAHLIGKSLTLPLVGRRIPVIADAHVDAAFGTGAVKVTPAHDFNDNEIGKRHDLPESPCSPSMGT